MNMEKALRLAHKLNALHNSNELNGETWDAAVSDFEATSNADKSTAYFWRIGKRVIWHSEEQGYAVMPIEFTDTVWTPYDQYKKHVGKKFNVLRQVDPNTYDFDEVGAMWVIQFEDGTEIQALPEEIERECVEEVKLQCPQLA